MMNFDKTLELGKRIYNNKMVEEKDADGKVILSDAEAIKALCSKAFAEDGTIRNLEDCRSFNKLIVETANVFATAQIEPIIRLMANYSVVGVYDTKVYEVPKKAKITMAVSASGTGVDFQRIPVGSTKRPAVGEKHQFGAKYNVSEMISDPVNAFKRAVDFVVEYKYKYIFNKIMALAKLARTANKIPADQWIETANLSLIDYRKAENKLLRYGNGVRPVMIADQNFIDAMAVRELTTVVTATGDNAIFATEDLKNRVLRESEFKMVSRTLTIKTVNPYTDDMNSKTDLNIQEAIVLAGGDKSPFSITEFGGMRILQDVPQIEGEDVNLKIDMKMDITLLLGQAMVYLKDTSVI